MYQLNIFASCCKRTAQNRINYIFDKSNLQSNLPLTNFNVNALKNASFNVFLSNPKMYRYLYFYINIFIVYKNNTYRHTLISKRITAEDSNKYLNINLKKFLIPSDLNNFKLIIIDILNANGFLYFSRQSSTKGAFLNFTFNSCKDYTSSKHHTYTLDDLINLYNPKVPAITSSSNLNNDKSKNAGNPIISSNNFKTDNRIIDTSNMAQSDNYINAAAIHDNHNIKDSSEIIKKNFNKEKNLNHILSKPNGLDKIIRRIKSEDFRSLFLKLLNKYIEVEVEFNCIKVLHGILEKVTDNSIILKDGNYKHFVLIDSVSIIHTPDKINIDDIIFNNEKSDISRMSKYLKANNIKIKLNDKYMHISTVEIIDYCTSFIEVEDTKTKKIYFLNSDHIKTIESIPIK